MGDIISMTYDAAQGAFACDHVRKPYWSGMSNELGEEICRLREQAGLSKAALGRVLGVSGAAISQWEAGVTKPSPKSLAEFARALHVPLSQSPFREYLAEKLGAEPFENYDHRDRPSSTESAPRSERQKPELQEAPEAPPYESIVGLARDIPVLGNAVAGRDADFRLNGSETDRAIRPPGLAKAKGIFALYTVNDSMYPAWRENALFYVNPYRTPRIGDDVVVEIISESVGEPGAAFLKRLKARRGDKVIVEQFNPPLDIEFERDSVRLYRVIPWEEALGLS